MAVIAATPSDARNVTYQVMRGQRLYNRSWCLTTDSRNDGEVTVLAYVTAHLPSLFTPIVDLNGATDAGAVATQIQVHQRPGNPFMWDVSITFDSQATPQAYANQNPLLRAPRWSYEQSQFQKPCLVDQNGKMLCTSAGTPFDPPYMVDDGRPILVVQRNELIFDEAQQTLYKDTINSDVWRGKAAGTVKMSSMVGNDAEENGIYYFSVTRRFEVRPEGWNASILDQDIWYLLNGVRTQITSQGRPITRPVLLNGTGGTTQTLPTPWATGHYQIRADGSIFRVDGPFWLGPPKLSGTIQLDGIPAPIAVVIDNNSLRVNWVGVPTATLPIPGSGVSGVWTWISPTTPTTASGPNFLQFVVYKSLPFSVFGF